jgi:putative copper export protein
MQQSGYSVQKAVEAFFLFLNFSAYFLMIGALGFRFGVVRRARGLSDEAKAVLRPDNAALFGMVGACLIALFILAGPAIQAVVNHWSYYDSLAKNSGSWPPLAPPLVKLAVLGLAFLGFAMARVTATLGWWIFAAIATFTYMLEPTIAGDLIKRVNTLHIIAVSAWIGTLLVLTVIGIVGVSRSNLSGIQRATLVADLVNTFSPIALIGFIIAAVAGVWTGWLHLKRLSAMWTTPWGLVFDVKLALALIVISIGAWNWRRIRPSLGGEGSEEAIRKSARKELMFAALVVLVTAVLVTVERPK